MRKLHHNHNYYITYTSIHNYYITVRNKSGYRAGTRPSVFHEGSGYTRLARGCVMHSCYMQMATTIGMCIMCIANQSDDRTQARLLF